ncbi:MAG: hypothetical protein ACOX7K_04405 [Oscillospiraceae bacterium]|jgi:hypothetical protein
MAKRKNQRKEEQILASNELQTILSELNSAYIRFNTTVDPDLTDACIFEIHALRCHYNAALQHTKSLFE